MRLLPEGNSITTSRSCPTAVAGPTFRHFRTWRRREPEVYSSTFLTHRYLRAKRGELISGAWPNGITFLKDLGVVIGFLVIAVPLLAVIVRLIGIGPEQVSYAPKTWVEAVLWLPVAGTAGFVEELVFRGYLTRQFRSWTNSMAWAVLIQGLLFGLAHGYYSRAMIGVAFYGCLLGLLAGWRKSLRPGMVAMVCRMQSSACSHSSLSNEERPTPVAQVAPQI